MKPEFPPFKLNYLYLYLKSLRFSVIIVLLEKGGEIFEEKYYINGCYYAALYILIFLCSRSKS